MCAVFPSPRLCKDPVGVSNGLVFRFELSVDRLVSNTRRHGPFVVDHRVHFDRLHQLFLMLSARRHLEIRIGALFDDGSLPLIEK